MIVTVERFKPSQKPNGLKFILQTRTIKVALSASAGVRKNINCWISSNILRKFIVTYTGNYYNTLLTLRNFTTGAALSLITQPGQNRRPTKINGSQLQVTAWHDVSA